MAQGLPQSRAASTSFAALEAQSSSASIEAGKKAVPDQDVSSLPSWARAQTPSLPASKARARFELLLPWLAGAAGIALLAGYALMARSPAPSLDNLGSGVQMSKAAPWMSAAGICALAILALGLAFQWGAGLWARRTSKKSTLAKQSANAKPAKASKRPKSQP